MATITKLKPTTSEPSKDETRQLLMSLWDALEALFYELEEEIAEGGFRDALTPGERADIISGCERCVSCLAACRIYPPTKTGGHILQGVLDAVKKQQSATTRRMDLLMPDEIIALGKKLEAMLRKPKSKKAKSAGKASGDDES
jgi:hypothetical protein